MSKISLPKFTIRQLLEAGVHFGHKSMRCNPKMKPYIYTKSNGVSIIDLNKTATMLNTALKTVKEVAKNNGRILFVATKKQAIEPVAEAAKRCGQYYVNFRWLGGMLTNWKTVSRSIKTLKEIEVQLANKESDLNKKERLVLERKRLKLEQALGGIKDMGGYPDLVFIIDTHKEALAVAEAKTLKVPIMAILDSNCDPDGITFGIPGNDDSTKSIKLYCRLISDAIIAGIKENMILAGVDVSKLEGSELPADIQILKPNNAAKSERKPDTRKPEGKRAEFKKDSEKLGDKADKKPATKAPLAKKSAAKPSVSKASDTKPSAAKKPAAKK